jgi:subfamily B ATP-binding cassette protein MsbA
MQRGLAAAASVFGLIDLESEADKGTKTIARAEGRLSVQDVSFHYRGADGKPLDPDARPALDHVSLDIAAGETVALVGSSGSGKTTLAGLLPRFYDVSGSIQLDGVDLRDYTMTSLRQQIALVSQDVVLFNDTLAANIAYGDPAPSMERIEAAAAAPMRMNSSCASRKATTRQSVKTACACQAASASAWRLRARCTRTRRS